MRDGAGDWLDWILLMMENQLKSKKKWRIIKIDGDNDSSKYFIGIISNRVLIFHYSIRPN